MVRVLTKSSPANSTNPFPRLRASSWPDSS